MTNKPPATVAAKEARRRLIARKFPPKRPAQKLIRKAIEMFKP